MLKKSRLLFFSPPWDQWSKYRKSNVVFILFSVLWCLSFLKNNWISFLMSKFACNKTRTAGPAAWHSPRRQCHRQQRGKWESRCELSIAGQHHTGTSDSSGRWHESRERLLSEQQASTLSLVSVKSWFPWQQRPT